MHVQKESFDLIFSFKIFQYISVCASHYHGRDGYGHAAHALLHAYDHVSSRSRRVCAGACAHVHARVRAHECVRERVGCHHAHVHAHVRGYACGRGGVYVHGSLS